MKFVKNKKKIPLSDRKLKNTVFKDEKLSIVKKNWQCDCEKKHEILNCKWYSAPKTTRRGPCKIWFQRTWKLKLCTTLKSFFQLLVHSDFKFGNSAFNLRFVYISCIILIRKWIRYIVRQNKNIKILAQKKNTDLWQVIGQTFQN